MPNLVPIQIVRGISYARQECSGYARRKCSGYARRECSGSARRECSGSARRKCSVNVLWTLQHIFEGIADDTDHHE